MILKQLLVSPCIRSENYADQGGCYSPSRMCSYVLAHVFVGGFTMKVPPWCAWRFKEWQQRVRLKVSSKSVPDISTVISINVACEQANSCKFEEQFWRRSRHHTRRMCRGKVAHFTSCWNWGFQELGSGLLHPRVWLFFTVDISSSYRCEAFVKASILEPDYWDYVHIQKISYMMLK